jgi:hypothetical protein
MDVSSTIHVSNSSIPAYENGPKIFTDEEIERHLFKANQLAMEILGDKPREAPDNPSTHLGYALRYISDAFFADNFERYSNFHQAFKENVRFKEEFSSNCASKIAPDRASKIKTLLEEYSKLLERKRENSLISCALDVTLIAGTILFFGGLISSVVGLALTGGVIGLGVYCIRAARFMCNRNVGHPDVENVETAKAIHRLWKHISSNKIRLQ